MLRISEQTSGMALDPKDRQQNYSYSLENFERHEENGEGEPQRKVIFYAVYRISPQAIDKNL